MIKSKSLLTGLLLLVAVTATAQTFSDTASLIPGTKKRGLPTTAPVMAEPPESNSISLIIPMKADNIKQEAQRPESKVQNNERVGYTDTLITNAYRKALVSYYKTVEKRNIGNAATFDSVTAYYSWALKNRQQIIARQQTTGHIIFILVVILVLSGLVFAAIQFYIALKSAKKKGAIPDTSLKASLSGVEVSSSVLGVIILTLSIVFFYLYLTKVYPLVTLDQVETQAPK